MTINFSNVPIANETGTLTGAPASIAGPAVDPSVTSAREVIQNLLHQYDLDQLAPEAYKLIKSGLSTDAIILNLSQTQAYKQRFAANELRVKNGLTALSPAEYIALERQYGQTLRSYGLPAGFYDQRSDFTKFIANDVSPAELNQRAQQAAQAVQEAPKEYRDALQKYYGLTAGDLAAQFLDPKRAEPLLAQKEYAARIGGYAASQGINVNANYGQTLEQQGVSLSQAQQGIQQAAQVLPTEQKLSEIYGGNNAVSQQDVLGEFVQGNAQAASRRRKLNQLEQASFSGQSGGLDSRTLQQYSPGSF